MGFLDSLSKTLSSGTDRVKFEADKFQKTTKINGELLNLKTQVETNLRQLGERTLELYQQGAISAPEVASLAQIVAQLREQMNAKEKELEALQSQVYEPETTPAAGTPAQQVPIVTSQPATPPAPSVVSSTTAAGSTPYACATCGASLPQSSAFCPNCGARVATS